MTFLLLLWLIFEMCLDTVTADGYGDLIQIKTVNSLSFLRLPKTKIVENDMNITNNATTVPQ